MSSSPLNCEVISCQLACDILLLFEHFKPSFWNNVMTIVGVLLAFLALLFSFWLYLNNEFKQRFHFLIQQITTLQNHIYPRYFFDQLDKIHNQGQIDFNQSHFSESRIYSSIIKFIFELLKLIDKTYIGKKYTLSLFKTLLSNEAVWIGSIYAMQNTSLYGVSNNEFKRLWCKHNMLEGICLFASRYGIDQMQEMTNEQINDMDERMFEHKPNYERILGVLQNKLLNE